MSGVRRFLSRRDKSPGQHHHRLSHHQHDKPPPPQTEPKPQPNHFDGVFTLTRHDSPKKSDKEEEKKTTAVIERLRHYGIDNISEANVEYALHAQSSQGDPEAAFRLLMMLEDTYEGIMRSYDPSVKLLGAVNRGMTTCYLDALLFAMFARLDSFEAMLYETFEDAKRKRLAGLLRLWVNMLRTGRLITVDLTEHIQNALADCGWQDAARHRQQDPSEAFGFITGQLELPMLTLKMDMYHTGKEDPQDDHKFVNERLLEVALLDEPVEGRQVITLEDCLEHYFNNKIEVKRHMESQRRNTLKSASYMDAPTKVEKESGAHIEVMEVGPETPLAQSPAVLTPLFEAPPHQTKVEQLRPSLGRKRADSIFSQRRVDLTGIDPEELKRQDTNGSLDAKGRKLSTRTEVLMPAWQFFKLLPWYTDHMPTSDAQVAAHFSKKRPILGICLKRYSYTNEGQARRRDTYIDIPLEIAVPNFVSDDTMQDEGPLMGNFRLMLQSVVCHRGVSVNSGHYICLARGRFGTGSASTSSTSDRRNSHDSDQADDPWTRFDDLAPERTTPVDIHEVLRSETPYLLFYQVMPIDEDGHSIHDLPSYTEATSRSQSDAAPLEKPFSDGSTGSADHLEQVMSEPTPHSRASTEVLDFVPASSRASIDTGTVTELPRGRLDPREVRRKSITFDTSSFSGSVTTDTTAGTSSIPTTPSEEKSNSFLAVANKLSGSRRGSGMSKKSDKEKSKSRPTSTGPDSVGNRFSLNMSKLTQIMSNNSGNNSSSSKGDARSAEEVAVIQGVVPSEHVAAELAGQKDVVEPKPAAPHDQTAPEVVAAPERNASKESVTAPTVRPPKPTVAIPPQPAPAKSKKGKEREKAAAKHHAKAGGAHGHGRKGASEDRDCCVM